MAQQQQPRQAPPEPQPPAAPIAPVSSGPVSINSGFFISTNLPAQFEKDESQVRYFDYFNLNTERGYKSAPSSILLALISNSHV